MSGHQKLLVSISDVLNLFRESGITPPSNAGELPDSFEYADAVLAWLGADRIESLDYSEYEGATFVWDLNTPIPDEWHEQFDFVLDGGTIEYVFNVPQVLANYMNLVRVGGRVMVITPANNAVGHGFYQFCPELFNCVFSPDNGFEVNRMVLYEVYYRSPIYEIADSATSRSILQLSNSWLEVYLVVEASRTRKTELFRTWPQQSYYTEGVWTGKSQESRSLEQILEQAGQDVRGRRRVRETLKRRFPLLRQAKQWVDKNIIRRSHPVADSSAIKWSREWQTSLRKQYSFTARPDWFRPIQ
jgi:hypothetical protein